MSVTIGSVGTECRMAVMAELVRKQLLKLEGNFKVMSPTNMSHLVTEAEEKDCPKSHSWLIIDEDWNPPVFLTPNLLLASFFSYQF